MKIKKIGVGEASVFSKRMKRDWKQMRMNMWVMLTCPKCGHWFLFANDTKEINYAHGDDFMMTPQTKLPQCDCKQ